MARLCSEHARADGWPTKYDLVGVVRHRGVGIRSGHYRFIQRLSTGTFISRDDMCVEEVTNPLAYKTEATGLIYQRCAPTRFEHLANLCVLSGWICCCSCCGCKLSMQGVISAGLPSAHAVHKSSQTCSNYTTRCGCGCLEYLQHLIVIFSPSIDTKLCRFVHLISTSISLKCPKCQSPVAYSACL